MYLFPTNISVKHNILFWLICRGSLKRDKIAQGDISDFNSSSTAAEPHEYIHRSKC